MNYPETSFLVSFFTNLNVAGIRYAVMRNSETLPESLGGSDLDLLVEDDNAAQGIIDIAKRVAVENGGAMTVLYRTGAIVVCLAGNGSAGWWGCHIDVFVGLKYYGLPYVDAYCLMGNRVLEKGVFYRLGDETDVVSFVKEILYTGRTRKDYYPRAREYFKNHHTIVENLFSRFYGEDGWQLLKAILSDEHDAIALKNSSSVLARSMSKAGMRMYSPVCLLKVKAVNLMDRLSRLFRRPGFSVAFLGTDGSGKSTLIEHVKGPMEQMLHSKVHYEHLRPNLIPSLARLAGKPQREGPTTDPHGGKVSGWLFSLVRFTYYYIDYVVGYWAKIYPILVKRPSMVIFDRYYYEYMIDPRRCAVKLPRGWARFWSWFIPRPDLILCLGGEPEKIYARKPETSLEEVRRQVDVLQKFCNSNSRAVWIDTTASIHESVDVALTAVIERMAERYK